MLNIPLNHKTIFLFDHANCFSNNCGQTFEFDVPNKSKASNQNQAQNIQKLNPLNKTLWSCIVESAFEFSRIVYDIFPENKLIRLIVSKLDQSLNNWNENEQGLDHLMNAMGKILPPLQQTRQLFEGEEFINLCKALNTAVNCIAQATQLQQNLFNEYKSSDMIKNSGRIILFTSSKQRDLDRMQEFLEKAIQECNKNIEQSARNERILSSLKINMIELVIVDVVGYNDNLTFEKEFVKQRGSELRTRILSCKAGQHLPLKMIQLVQNFYELSVTSVTNIPMKEELNANSSANYDVDILHVKSLHDQLKICGLLKNCIVQKDGVNAVCLKWSNPKTNITEFNYSSCSYRITPIDVNSRPASCLTSFLLGGRCVVLEVPRSNNSSNQRISSHVLCNNGNEIFMNSLNCCGKSILEDRPSIEINNDYFDYRINDFVDIIRANTLTNLSTVYDSSKADLFTKKITNKFEKLTRKWPLSYNENITANMQQLKPIVKYIPEESLNDIQYNECIKSIEQLQNAEFRNEPILNSLISTKNLSILKLDNPYKVIWENLEDFLKAYQDSSEKHKAIYLSVKKSRLNALQIDNTNNRTEAKKNQNKGLNEPYETEINYELEKEKLSKRRKFSNQLNISAAETNLLDFWSNTLNEINNKRLEFYGRTINPPNSIAPLYTNLKLEETQSGKSLGNKIAEMA